MVFVFSPYIYLATLGNSVTTFTFKLFKDYPWWMLDKFQSKRHIHITGNNFAVPLQCILASYIVMCIISAFGSAAKLLAYGGRELGQMQGSNNYLCLYIP